MVPGLAIGDLCAACAQGLARRAARIGRWVAMGTTLPLAVYMTVTLPAEKTARIVGATAALVWFFVTSLIARRVAWEWMK